MGFKSYPTVFLNHNKPVMKKSNLFFVAFVSVALTNCRKNYVCECTNPGGTFKAFTTNGTKEKADKKCKDYYDENYGKVLMNETYCEVK
jgi:hypothetical protein